MTLLLMLLLKSLLVFALSGVALLCLRRASASARHLVCLLTLAALLALPLFSLTLPGWHVAGLQEAPTPPQAATLPIRSNAKHKREGAETTGSQSSPALPLSAPAKTFPLLDNIAPSKTPRLPAPGGQALVPSRFLLLALYILGIVLAALRPLLGLRGIAHLRRACIPVSDAPTLGVSADCAAALRLSRLPLLCRADVPVPMTWGGRRPVVLLPSGPAAWPEERLRSVLLHEMAHIKRRDWTCHRLADVACALYWFHPLVWMAARRLRAESEVACDDLVLSSGIAAPDYARHLLDIARALSPASCPPQSAAIAMAQTSHIKGRILMILDKTHSRRAVTRRVLLIALVPSAAALLTLAALRPSVKAQALAAATGNIAAPVTVPIGGYPLKLRFGNATTIRMDNRSGQPSLAMSRGLTIDGTTLLAGVNNPHSNGNKWWSATGALLTAPVYDTAANSHEYAGPKVQSVKIAFRLPPSAQGVTVQYKLPQSSGFSCDGDWPGKSQSDAGRTESQMFASTSGVRIVSATFPPALKKATAQVGIASGTWTTAVSMIRTPGAVEPFGESSGSMTGGLFVLTTPDETTKGLLLTLATNSTEDLRFIAIDNGGHTLLPSDIGGESSSSGKSDLDQIKVHFSQPLSQIKEFRVQTRPFRWIEFKDVALQPTH